MKNDLISRKAAIDAICRACYFYDVCYEDDERCKDVAILRDFQIQDESDEPKEDDFCSYAERRTDDKANKGSSC